MVRDKNFYKTIFRLSVPSALQTLISLIVLMADNMMVRGVNEYALSAVSQSNAISVFVTAALNGLAGGSVVLVSQYFGKRDMKSIRVVCSVSMSLCIALSLAAAAAVRLFPQSAVAMVVSENKPGITATALEYLPIVCLSYLPYAVTAAAVGMLKGVEVVRVTLYTACLSLITNIGLNYVLIYGRLGFPAMGVRGAAIATVLARLIECTLVCLYLFRSQKTLSVRPRDFLRHKAWAWRDYAKYGLPVGLTDAQWALVGLLKMSIIGQVAVPGAAENLFTDAVSVTDVMMNLGTMFTFALAGGACVVVGKAVGEKDYDRVRAYARTIQILFLCLGVFMCAAVFLARKPFALLYLNGLSGKSGQNAEALYLAGRMIAIGSLTLLGTTYHASCFIGINRGAGDNRFVMGVDMICGWLVVLPMTYLAYRLGWPPEIVYLMTRIDQCFKWLIAMLRLRGNKWIHNVTREAER